MELLAITALVTLVISYILSFASQINTVWKRCQQGRNEELSLKGSSKIGQFDNQSSSSKLSLQLMI